MSAQRRVRFAAFGGPEVLEVVDDALPHPGPGEVRVRVEASSVQFTDTLIRRGIYPDLSEKPPLTPGYDLVGRVDEVGEGVDAWAVGDRVADLCQWGGNARFVVRPAAGLVAVPEAVDATAAVSLVLSWLTAYQAAFTVGRLQPGERLLVIGGNGAVGQALVTLAGQAGAEVWATASARHHEALRAMGARPLPRDGVHAVRGEVDVVVDGVAEGGFGPSFRTLRRGGRLVMIGMSALADGGMAKALPALAGLGLRWLLPNGRRVAIYSIASRRKRRPEEFRRDLAHLLAELEAGRLAPEVQEVLALEDVADAHRRLEEGGLSGKLVLVP